MAIGGWDNIAVLKSVDLFPLPACSINSAICAIPDLPKPRLDHSLSLLPGGRLVVCGGRDFDYYLGQFFTLNTCITWAAGESTWTELYTMRCKLCIIAILSYDNVRRVARSFHTAWTPPASPNSLVLLGGGQSSADLSVEVLPSDTWGTWTNARHPNNSESKKIMNVLYTGAAFALEHGGYGACGIPDGETIILTGGFGHNYVTR